MPVVIATFKVKKRSDDDNDNNNKYNNGGGDFISRKLTNFFLLFLSPFL